jgi:hypothetical protein
VRRKAELQCETDARSNCSGESGPASPTSISTAAADGEYTDSSAAGGAVTPSNRLFESNGSCMSNSSSSHKNSGSAAALMKKKGSQKAVQPLDLAKLEEIAALQQLQQELRRANSKAAVMGTKRSSVVSLASAAAILDRKNSTSSSSYGTVTSAASTAASGNRKRSDASNVSTGSRDSRANSTAGLRLVHACTYTNSYL